MPTAECDRLLIVCLTCMRDASLLVVKLLLVHLSLLCLCLQRKDEESLILTNHQQDPF